MNVKKLVYVPKLHLHSLLTELTWSLSLAPQKSLSAKSVTYMVMSVKFVIHIRSLKAKLLFVTLTPAQSDKLLYLMEAARHVICSTGQEKI